VTIIIDGYNLLKQREPRQFITEPQRQFLMRQAMTYGKKRGHQMVLVFDGGPLPNPSREAYNGVMVLYAGWQVTADDVIKEYIEGQLPDELLLVSSDAQLCTFASHHGVTSIDSLAFWEIMEDTLKQKSERQIHSDNREITKTTERSNELVDTLMYEASESVPDKDRGFERAKKRLRDQKKGSKAERLLKKKLAKL
jgi:predicted RNA-binding protein with PIN domain